MSINSHKPINSFLRNSLPPAELIKHLLDTPPCFDPCCALCVRLCNTGNSIKHLVRQFLWQPHNAIKIADDIVTGLDPCLLAVRVYPYRNIHFRWTTDLPAGCCSNGFGENLAFVSETSGQFDK